MDPMFKSIIGDHTRFYSIMQDNYTFRAEEKN